MIVDRCKVDFRKNVVRFRMDIRRSTIGAGAAGRGAAAGVTGRCRTLQLLLSAQQDGNVPDPCYAPASQMLPWHDPGTCFNVTNAALERSWYLFN